MLIFGLTSGIVYFLNMALPDRKVLVFDSQTLTELQRAQEAFTRAHDGYLVYVPDKYGKSTKAGFEVDGAYDPNAYSFWSYIHGLVIPLKPGDGQTPYENRAREVQAGVRKMTGVIGAIFVLIVPDRSEGTTNLFLPLDPADLEKDEYRLRDEYNNAGDDILRKAMKESAYCITTGRYSIT